MNAQEKAKELVEKFLNAEFNCKECNMPFCDIPCTKLSLFEAKQFAIIAVDEIILVCAFHDHTKKKYFEECNSLPDYNFSTYWIEVKQEIQNL